MDRAHRPIGLTALAFASVAVGMYAQIAAMAVMLGGVFGLLSAAAPPALVLLSVVYIGVMLGAYVVAFGFWTERPWAWSGGIGVFTTFIVANVPLALIADDPTSAIATGVGAAVGLVYLIRHGKKASLPDRATGHGASTATSADSPALEAASTPR